MQTHIECQFLALLFLYMYLTSLSSGVRYANGLSCRYWSLKEAFVKAMGTGVGYKLDNVEFCHMSWDDIFVKVDGEELKDWKFWLLDLGQKHAVRCNLSSISLHIIQKLRLPYCG